MFTKLKNLGLKLVGVPTVSAEEVSPRSVIYSPQDNPKVRKNGRAYPSRMTSTTMPSDQSIRLTDRNLATTDIAMLSRTGGTREVIRELAYASPDLSAALAAHLRTAITPKYKAVAKNMDGSFNEEGTNIVNQILVRLDNLPDFSEGFTQPNSIRSCSESLGREAILYGAMAVELVLDDALLPKYIQPVSVDSLEFRPKGKRLVPVQVVGDRDIRLDEATFFYIPLDQDLLEAYSSSPFESAIKPTFFIEMLMSDITRVIKRAIHPRVKVVIDEEAIRKSAPPEAVHDGAAMEEYVDRILSQVENSINTLNPEDALVHFDYIKVEMLNNGNISLSREIETLENMGDSMMSTGTKTPPTVLGHHRGSSNIASTETLLFLKQVEGAVQFKLNELFSRVLTLAVRLFGVDCYVEFAYEPIELRPDTELEAFKSQKQSRYLELLSIGKISDEEFSLEILGRLPREGEERLSGTFFKSKDPSSQNPYMGEQNSGSTLNQDLQPDTPTVGGGQNNKANPLKESDE